MITIHLYTEDADFVSAVYISKKVEVVMWNNRIFVLRTDGNYYEVEFLEAHRI